MNTQKKTETQVDIAGRIVRIGDTVATTYGNMSALNLMEVVSITPRGVKARASSHLSSKNHSPARAGAIVQRSSDQICLVETPTTSAEGVNFEERP